MSTRSNLLSSLSIAFLLTGCSLLFPEAESGIGDPKPLMNTGWELRWMGDLALEKDQVSLAFSDSLADMPVDLEDSTGLFFELRLFCNRGGGVYKVAGEGAINLDFQFVTEAYCGREKSQTADEFVSRLEASTRYGVEGDVLTLATEAGPTLVFERAAWRGGE